MSLPIETRVPRTLREARARCAQFVFQSDRDAGLAQVEAETAKARQTALRRAEELRASGHSAGSTAFERANEITTEAKAIRADLSAGRISTADARRRLDQLASGLRLSRATAAVFEHDVAAADQIEADPVAYTESLYERYPTTRPTFTF